MGAVDYPGVRAAEAAPHGGAAIVHDWRDRDHYRLLAALDAASLMWEWLRRNADYQRMSADVPEPACRIGSGVRIVMPSMRIAPEPWGLQFRNALDDLRA